LSGIFNKEIFENEFLHELTLRELHNQILRFMRYRFLLLYVICGLTFSSIQGQTISKKKCIEDIVFNATLDSIPPKSEFLPRYIDSLICFPILFSENANKTFTSENSIRFRNFSCQDLQSRKITNYIEVQRFEIFADSAFLELFNRIENMYVISRFKIIDCKIISGETNIIEF